MSRRHYSAATCVQLKALTQLMKERRTTTQIEEGHLIASH